jgi:hypothetical protein
LYISKWLITCSFLDILIIEFQRISIISVRFLFLGVDLDPEVHLLELNFRSILP